MKIGKTIVQLAQEIEKQAASRHDYLVPAPKVRMVTQDQKPVIELEGIGERVSVRGKKGGILPTRFAPTEIFHDQMAGAMKINRDYYKRMRVEAPELLAVNVNHWLGKSEDVRMVRTMDNRARALLSNRYRPIDNDLIATAVLPILKRMGDVEIVSAEVTEMRLYIQFVTPKLQGEVKKGDIVQAGGVISNSEVGIGAFAVEDLLYRLVCLNGMVVSEAMRRKHVGRRSVNELTEDATEYYTDATRKLDDRALMAKVSDTVAAFFNKDRFERVLETSRRGAKRLIEADPQDVITEVTRRFSLSEEEGGGVLKNLIKGADLSQWGLTNAVTALANTAKSYDRAVQLEKIGGEIIELTDEEWTAVAA